MAVPPITDGLHVRYQGITCTPLYSYPRSTGLEADVGYVHMIRDQFRNFTVKPSLKGVDAPKTDTTTRTDDEAADGLLSVGELEISETIDGIKHDVTWQGVLVAERAMTSVIATDDGSDIVRVEISDMRLLWRERGIISAWINVIPRGGAALAGRAGVAAAGAARVNGSLRGGQLWTLRQVLTELILPALPAAPKLKRMPPALERETPRGHIWAIARPKQALADLLAEFKLTLALNHDGSISLWEEAEGAAQLSNGKDIPSDVVSHAIDSVAYHWRPQVVVVVGPPIIETIKMAGLEPVGELGGEILPLEEAVKGYGFGTLGEAMMWATSAPAERAWLFKDITPEAIRELDRWMLKWYRLPGGELKNTDKLPILKARPSLDVPGQLLPIVVEAEAMAVVNAAALLAADAKGPAAVQARKAVAAGGKDPMVCYNLPMQEATAGYSIDHERGIVQFSRMMATFGRVGPSGAVELAGPATVDITFAHEKKPAIDGSPSLDDRYVGIFERETTGKPRRLKAIPGGAIPEVIERKDLRMVRDMTDAGANNRAQLDVDAEKMAAAIFSRPAGTEGQTIQLHRPMPVINTGAVKSVIHRSAGELPRVDIHIGVKAPWSPAESNLTVERGLIIDARAGVVRHIALRTGED